MNILQLQNASAERTLKIHQNIFPLFPQTSSIFVLWHISKLLKFGYVIFIKFYIKLELFNYSC